MDFIPSRADPCIWLKKNSKLNLYECIAVYVDDFCITAENAKELTSILKSKYHLKPDYFHNPDGTMVCHPKKYNDKLKKSYIRLFNMEPPKGLKTPLEKNDHPELDTTDILET